MVVKKFIRIWGKNKFSQSMYSTIMFIEKNLQKNLKKFWQFIDFKNFLKN